MRKMAIFVEGLTEQIFTEQLLSALIGSKHMRVTTYKASGGATFHRRLRQMTVTEPTSEEKYYVQIINCSNDERVKSDIRDRYDSLVAAHFDVIIGIRDVYPQCQFADISKLRAGLALYLPTVPINVSFILGIMEIETWFLMEYSHFPKINPKLTPEFIKMNIGFDPSIDDLQTRPCPCKDLDDIYHLAQFRYNKSEGHIKRTVDALDFASVYLELVDRLPDLKILVSEIDRFFSH